MTEKSIKNVPKGSPQNLNEQRNGVGENPPPKGIRPGLPGSNKK